MAYILTSVGVYIDVWVSNPRTNVCKLILIVDISIPSVVDLDFGSIVSNFVTFCAPTLWVNITDKRKQTFARFVINCVDRYEISAERGRIFTSSTQTFLSRSEGLDHAEGRPQAS